MLSSLSQTDLNSLCILVCAAAIFCLSFRRGR